MSEQRIAHRGEKLTIEFAELPDKSMPAKEFIEGLTKEDQAKIRRLIMYISDHHPIKNEQKFKNLGEEDLYELKSFHVRIPAFFLKGFRFQLVLTHGLIKKTDALPNSEIKRAVRIRAVCLNGKEEKEKRK